MKKTLTFASLFLICNLPLFAQTGEGSRVVHTEEKSAIHLPPAENPAGLTVIYTNLGTSKTDLYTDNSGYDIIGGGTGGAQFLAMVLTPKSDCHISRVAVAVQYLGGAKQVNLNLYSDANGVPGTLLAGPVTVKNLPEFGTCCALAAANFPPVAATAGTQYWVVANTPLAGTGDDFSGVWDFVVQKTPPFAIYDDSQGFWSAHPTLQQPAGQVLGTVP